MKRARRPKAQRPRGHRPKARRHRPMRQVLRRPQRKTHRHRTSPGRTQHPRRAHNNRKHNNMATIDYTRSGMQLLAQLVVQLGTSTKTNDKLASLTHYFAEADPADKVWVIALFSGRRPKRTVNSTLLWEWCRELTGLPGWLFEESYHVVGDLAETIALLLPEGDRDGGPGESLGYYLIRLAEL